MSKRVTVRRNKNGTKTKTASFTHKNVFGTRKTHTYVEDKKGCYVATCVYGSYDCEQVWTLRRYRDERLASTFWGRAFIRVYYFVSPTVVRVFGETKWFKGYFRKKLDKKVKRLNAEGVENTPYADKDW